MKVNNSGKSTNLGVSLISARGTRQCISKAKCHGDFAVIFSLIKAAQNHRFSSNCTICNSQNAPTKLRRKHQMNFVRRS